MQYDRKSNLWPNMTEHFFKDQEFRPVRQKGPHCVAAALSIITREAPRYFQERINTQDPISWSDALHPWRMKLAYCTFDIRKLRFYMDELVALDDLFILSYYCPIGAEILKDPNGRGWICGSHIVVLHRDKIFDSRKGDVAPAHQHECNNHYTKRIFRVVPNDYIRGI